MLSAYVPHFAIDDHTDMNQHLAPIVARHRAIDWCRDFNEALTNTVIRLGHATLISWRNTELGQIRDIKFLG